MYVYVSGYGDLLFRATDLRVSGGVFPETELRGEVKLKNHIGETHWIDCDEWFSASSIKGSPNDIKDNIKAPVKTLAKDNKAELEYKLWVNINKTIDELCKDDLSDAKIQYYNKYLDIYQNCLRILTEEPRKQQ